MICDKKTSRICSVHTRLHALFFHYMDLYFTMCPASKDFQYSTCARKVNSAENIDSLYCHHLSHCKYFNSKVQQPSQYQTAVQWGMLIWLCENRTAWVTWVAPETTIVYRLHLHMGPSWKYGSGHCVTSVVFITFLFLTLPFVRLQEVYLCICSSEFTTTDENSNEHL